ncbi:hypothetical protein [Clostridium sp.]|uniref:hypothetical protein n=1 Tax=Clostridium sp. TaxID=1506 RepID=UPI003D6C7E97
MNNETRRASKMEQLMREEKNCSCGEKLKKEKEQKNLGDSQGCKLSKYIEGYIF